MVYCKPDSIDRHLSRWNNAVAGRSEWAYEYYQNLRYLAGKTFTSVEEEVLRLQGRDRPNYNIIDGNIRLIEGMEARSRSDITALPRTPKDVDVANATTKSFFYFRDVNGADRQMSFAFRDMLRSGIGWVQVNDNPDPSKYPIGFRHIHASDVYTDPSGRSESMEDHLDCFRSVLAYPEAIAMRFPKFRDEVMNVPAFADGAAGILSGSGDYVDRHGDDPHVGQFGHGTHLYYEGMRSGDIKHERIRIVERWYRQECFKRVVKMADGTVYDPDFKNPRMMEWLAGVLYRGEAKILGAIVPVMRVAVFIPDDTYCGALLLSDAESPLPHSDFPLIPLHGYADENGRPVGIIEQWRSPQRDFNLRVAHLLKRSIMSQVFFESGSFSNLSQAKKALSEMNGMIEMSPGALGKMQIRDNLSGSELEVRLQSQNLQLLQEWNGPGASLLGQKTPETSGIAIQAKQSSGQTRLFTLFDSRDWAWERAGYQVLSLMKARLTDEQVIRVTDSASGVEFITINEKQPDGSVVNDLASAALDLKVIPTDSKATESMATLEAISNLLTQSPPEFAAIFMPAIAKLMPQSAEFVDEVKKVKDAILARLIPPEAPPNVPVVDGVPAGGDMMNGGPLDGSSSGVSPELAQPMMGGV